VPRRSCDGVGLFEAVGAAVANLEAHADEVDALNVFPVPDGDTGSNMLATCTEMLRYVRGTDTAADVADRLREGSLFGARGNSGVILSQIVRGIAEGFEGKHRFNGLDLANALRMGAAAAYGAVPRPVEGTMLTVIRETAEAAVAAAERDNDIDVVLAAAADGAHAALARTPSLLAILREAGVVDSGGAGLVHLLDGAVEYRRGGVQPPARVPAFPSPVPGMAPAAVETGHGYETVYLIHPFAGQLLDLDRIRTYLVRTGESVNVAGDPKVAKIHVHNGRPDLVLRQALRLGRIVNATIMDLDHQTEELREARAAATFGSLPGVVAPAREAPGRATDGAVEAANGAPSRVPLGIVAVAPGDGFERVFRSFAIRGEVEISVVRGGQAENPSAGEIFAAISSSAAEELVVLPNNANVKLAAGQAAEMADRPVRVVPTRNAAEGLAALLALDPSVGASGNADPMLDASRAIRTILVTEAVRDAMVSGRPVKRGQAMALDPDDGLLAVGDDRVAAVLEALTAAEGGLDLVTIWYGDGADLAEAEGLARRIQEALPALEQVEVQHGGQPHYRYLLSAE
jgi:uncharacterized protein